MTAGDVSLKGASYLKWISALSATPLRQCLVLAALALLLRFPSVFYLNFNWDEGAILSEAWAVSEGYSLYGDVPQIHPPLNFFIFVPLFKLLPPDLVMPGLKVIVTFWGAASAMLMTRIVSRATRDGAAGLVAGVLTLSVLCSPRASAYGELLAVLPILAALWLLLGEDSAWYSLGAGALCGVAILFKQSSALDAVVIFGAVVVARRRSVQALVWGVLGTLLIVAAVGSYTVWAAEGLIGAVYLNPFVLQGYVQNTPSSPLHVLRAMASIFSVAALLAGVMAMLRVGGRPEHRDWTADARILFWSGCVWVVLLLLIFGVAGRFFAHYLIQMVPAVAISTSVLLTRLDRNAGVFCLLLAILLTMGFTGRHSAALFLNARANDWEPPFVREARQIAEVVRSHSGARDTLFLIGPCQLEIHYLAQRRSPNGIYMYIDAAREHMGDVSLYQDRIQALRRSPPDVLVINRWGCFHPKYLSIVALRDELLGGPYRLVGEVNTTQVYVRDESSMRTEAPSVP